jgi:hypothetical protein
VGADPGSAWWRESTVTNPSELTADVLELAIWLQAHDLRHATERRDPIRAQ